MNWKQKQREKGWQDIMVWLSPEANKVLMNMIEETGKKKQELVSEALLAYAGLETRDVSSQKLENRIEALEERVERLEKPHDPSLEIIKAKKEEGKSYKEIAKELNEEGIPRPSGTKGNLWTSDGVRKYFYRYI